MTDYGRIARCSAAAVAAILLFGASHAVRAQDLPDARDLLARYHEAVGAQTLGQKQSVHSVGEFALPAMGISAPFEAFSARPNRSAVRIQIAGFGEFRRGHNGEVAWAIDPMEGPRLLRGAELAEATDEASFDSSLRPEALVASMTTVERTTLAGRDCYKVKVVWKSGRETFDCYSPESGLLIGSLSRQSSPMGEVDAVALYDDYRDFGGVKMAGRITVQVLGNEQVITVREVTFDTVADSTFETPAEIKALIRQ